jgi:ferric-dicitrate binding protein FerR (iron transport regulator)
MSLPLRESRDGFVKEMKEESHNAPASKAEIEEWITRLLSDERLPEDVSDDIRSYLAGSGDAELKREVLQKAFLSAFLSGGPGSLSEDAAREWPRLAASLGLDPDLARYRTLWEARMAGKALRTSFPGRVRMPVRRLAALRIAAVLLPAALILGGYFWWERSRTADPGSTAGSGIQTPAAVPFVATNTVATQADSIRHFMLADGTQVSLNSGSSLSYNDSREVELSGEAYFNVAKDSLHPFVVHSDRLTVTALGTEFNFNTRGRDGTSKLSLYEGRVKLDYAAGTCDLETVGSEFTLDHATARTTLTAFDAGRKPEWMSGREFSRIMSLGEIFDSLEREYGVTIAGREAADMNSRINFAIHKMVSIEEVMTALEYANSGFHYTIDGDTITLEKLRQ